MKDRHPDEHTRPYLTLARIEGDPPRLLDAYRRQAAVMDGVGHDHGLIFHAAAVTPDGLLIVNLWPAAGHSDSAAADPRRRGALHDEGIDPRRQRKEHHDVDRYVVFTRS